MLLTKAQKIRNTKVVTTQINTKDVPRSRNVQVTCGICGTKFPLCGISGSKIDTKCPGCKTEFEVYQR